MATPLGLGIRVVRGPDWKWGEQDGGEGFTGTVVDICGPKSAGGSGASKSPENTVILQWDVGSRTNYRIGHQNAYDLRVIDNAPIGIRHANINCKSCGNNSRSGGAAGLSGIFGIRWNCSNCLDVDLCTPCYMAEKHDTSHLFWRIDRTNETSGVLVPSRRGSRKVPLKGIYPGAKVKRGHDWAWEDQDGGIGKIGKVHDIQGWDKESDRSVASVTWSGSSVTNIYRVGHRGKVDLECIPGGAAVYGHYFPDHLPVLGRPPSLSVTMSPPKPVALVTTTAAPAATTLVAPPTMSSTPGTTTTTTTKPAHDVNWSVGERVEVGVSFEVLQQLQENHGGFNPRMSEILGKTGVIHRITNNGDIRVQYPGTPETNYRWTINPKALAKVTAFKSDDVVRIIEDVSALVRLQQDHGEWSQAMANAAGKTGRVVRVYADGDVRVRVIGNIWTFNPACLRVMYGSQTQMNNTNVHEGNDAGRYPILTVTPAAHCDANQLSQDIAKIQLEQIVTDAGNGNLEGLRRRLAVWQQKGSKNTRAFRVALQAAARKGHLEVVKLLVEQFPDQIDGKTHGKTPLHVSAFCGQLPVVAFILDATKCANIDVRDDDGDSALHLATVGRQLETMKYLLSRGADVNAVNLRQCTALHMAAVTRNPDAVALLLRQPNINVNMTDSYKDTPLHEAISKEEPEILNLICTFPATDFSVYNRKGFNCLHYASMKGSLLAVSLIIARARHLVELKKEDGFSPLLLASLNGHADCVKLLLDEGRASPDITDSRGQTALHLAVQQGHAAVIETIISRVDASTAKRLINRDDVEGETSLHVAVSREGDPPVPLSVQTAPLTFDIANKAEQFGVPRKLVHAISIATFLVSKGGKLTPKNRRGHTPLEHVSDPLAKAFLLDRAAQRQVSRPQHSQPATANATVPTTVQASAAAARSTTDRLSPSSSPSECRICCESLPRVTFEPCGHRIVCVDCSARMKKCMACDVEITNKLCPNEASGLKSDRHIHALEAKVQDLEDRFLCTICMERNKTIVFLCGHGACSDCAENLSTCHMCRSVITNKIFLY